MQSKIDVGTKRVLLLDRADVLSLWTWPELIGAARRALAEEANAPTAGGATGLGVSTQVSLPGASLHLKVGVQSAPLMLSVKANLRPHSGDSSGAILVFDPTQQRLRAILASADVTALRTAAIAAVAAQLLTDSPVAVAILGAGPVGRRVDGALAQLGIATEVRWWSRSAGNAAAAIAQASTGVPHVCCDSVEAAVAGAGLVITCTPARQPILEVDGLDSNAVILALGADTPGKRELGPGVLATASVMYADVPADARRAGETAYLAETDAAEVRPLAVLLGPEGAPNLLRHKGARVVFDSVGSSAVDAATVAVLVEAALDAGVGSLVDFEGVG